MRKGAIFSQSVRMSLKNIRSNKQRSFLTMLGIIIGVAAVIALVTTVSGVTSYMMDQFTGMGAGSLTVSAYGTVMKSGLTENDLSDIAAIDNVQGISPSIDVTAKVVRGANVSQDVRVTGKGERYFVKYNNLIAGRALLASDMAGNIKVCMIDQKCAKVFFPGENPVGGTIRIKGITFTVVGLCKSDTGIMSEINGTGSAGDDGDIYIPYKNALRMNGKNSVNSLEVYVKDTQGTDEVETELKKLLDSTFNNADNAYNVINMETILSTMNTMENVMTGMLAGIASISLLVGGIGIMNMMLVSVSERTNEIGLRKALGANPGIIQLQFLMESIFLSAVGGIIGIIIGELLSLLASSLIGTAYIPDAFAVLLGFGFSVGVGVIFGWAPARKASRLNPIDALRSE